MDFREIDTPLARIDPTDTTFRITTRDGCDDLTASIRRVGLLSPPVLIGKETGFGIVSGFRRIAACNALKWPFVRTRYIPSNASRYECSLIAIGTNALERPLNLIEQSRALRLLSAHCPDPADFLKDAAMFGLPSSPAIVKKIEPLASLAPEIQKAIVAGILSMAMALEICRLDPRSARLLVELFNDLHLSLNKQREIVTLVEEIARRDGKTRLTVLSEGPLQEIRVAENLDRTQKARHIRSYLRQRRFPALSAAEETFKKHRRKLDLGQGVDIKPSPNFEGQAHTLTLTLKQPQDLDRLQEILARIRQHPSLHAILSKK